MIRQIIALLLLSLAIIYSMTYSQQLLQWIVLAQNWISDLLTQVFSGGPAGDLIRKLLALLVIPIAISLIPALIYFLVKRHWFPYFMHIVWTIWLIQITALIALYKAI